MLTLPLSLRRLMLAALAASPLMIAHTGLAQTTPNVTVEILGIGAESLLTSDLTDPDNDGLDALEGALDPSWNWAGITSSHEPDFEGGEFSFNIFDNKVGGGNDKWCCDDPTADNPVWVAVQFKEPITLTHFTVTSGNDSPDRDPTEWAIQGSSNGETYSDIYRFSVADATVPWDARNQVAKFTLPPGSLAYSYIRYIAFETPGSLHQINEIEYFGSVGPQTDTDADGMPDGYETKNGFNPNDPADAALDFDGDGVSNLNEYKAGTDPIDITKPVLNTAVGAASFNTVTLTFSENLDPVSAVNLANYSLSPSVAVTAASVKKNVVTLTTAAQTPGATAYTVTVNNVLDTSKNAVTANSTALFYSYLSVNTGVLKFSFWGAIDGTPVSNLTDDPRYPASPDWTGAVFSLNSRDILPTDANENYGASMEGFITPTESASYDFFLRSDDASELFISTDATAANVALQASELGCCRAFLEPGNDFGVTTAAPIAMTAGQKYFIRVLYKEGGGGDYGQVAWRKTTDTTPAASLTPIPGKFLSSAEAVPAPPEGAFLTQVPAANAKSVSPNTKITISHRDGKTEWTSANVGLKFNGATVTPVITKDGQILTINYTPPALLPSNSTNTVALSYLDAGGLPATREWSFVTFAYKGPTKDKVGNYPGLIAGSADFTADAGGHTGKAGDTAINLTLKGGPVVTFASAFTAAVNAATANDELSVSFWQKKLDVADSSAFTVNSPSSGSGRAFHAHVPWSDQSIYFDTVGCCDGTTQRINANIDTFPGYTGDAGFWTNNWHHFVFTKKGSAKVIWIDGQQFLTGDSTNPLPTDVDAFYMGSGGFGAELSHAIIDDFSVYGKELTGADALALFQGTVPTALPAAKGLLGYWDYNDAGAVTVPTLGISGSVITYTGVLQSSTTLNGTFAPVAGATSPYTVPAATTGAVFYRSAQ